MSRREHYQLNTRHYNLYAALPNTMVDPKAPAPYEGYVDHYPHFPDGDVLLVISASRCYKLHSDMLRRSSPTFDVLLDDEAAAELSKNAKKKGITTKFCLHLVQNQNAGARTPGGLIAPDHVLRRIPLNDGGMPIGAYPDLLGDANENGRPIPQFVMAWEKIIDAIYARGVEIGNSETDGIEFILESSGTVLAVAEYLGNPILITRPVEATLLSLGQVLHRSIATNPTPWLDFANRLHSKSLWKESLIHGAGRFNSPQMREALQNNEFQPEVVKILTEKANLLKALSQRTQSNLLSYYPEALQRTKTVGRADRDSIGRASYANDIMQWMGLTVWRHWISQQVCNDNTHNAADLGFEFFRLVSRAGEAYLDRNQLRQFHDYFPMSLKGESVMENRISELKQDGQGMVHKIMENHSYLDVERYPAGHMTCTWVGPDDYPWERIQREQERIEAERYNIRMFEPPVYQDPYASTSAHKSRPLVSSKRSAPMASASWRASSKPSVPKSFDPSAPRPSGPSVPKTSGGSAPKPSGPSAPKPSAPRTLAPPVTPPAQRTPTYDEMYGVPSPEPEPSGELKGGGVSLAGSEGSGWSGLGGRKAQARR